MSSGGDDAIAALEDSITVSPLAFERIERDMAGLRRLLYCVLATTGPVTIDAALIRLSRHLSCRISTSGHEVHGDLTLMAAAAERQKQPDGDAQLRHWDISYKAASE